MKRINNYFQNLLKKELNRDIFKIVSVFFVYLIVFSIFKAGLEYQNLIDFKTRDKEEKVNKVKYTLSSNNQIRELEFDSKKGLQSIIESVPELNLEILSYYQGIKITKINSSSNVLIKIDGEILNENLITESYSQIKDGTKIEITY